MFNWWRPLLGCRSSSSLAFWRLAWPGDNGGPILKADSRCIRRLIYPPVNIQNFPLIFHNAINYPFGNGLYYLLWSSPSGKRLQFANWKDPPFFMGNSTISMAIFSIALCKRLPEGMGKYSP